MPKLLTQMYSIMKNCLFAKNNYNYFNSKSKHNLEVNQN